MKLNEMFDSVYCVNLDRRKDRWKASRKEFKEAGINVTRFRAIENENPAVGCWMSHLEILKKARDENKNVFIFEDDIFFIKENLPVIEKAVDELKDTDWVLFYLGGNILKPFYQVSDHLARLSHCQSTHAYGVNKKHVSDLVNFIENRMYIIDVLYANFIVPKTPCFITVPMVAVQRDDYSDIEKRIMTYAVPIHRYNTFLVRK